MRSPFQSEAAAFRFLLATLASFAAIAIASTAGGWIAGLVVWALASVAALTIYARAGRGRPLPSAPAHAGGPDERRILVVAPVAASPLRRLSNDTDAAQAQARERAAAAAGALQAPNVTATSVVGEDPVLAVADALRTVGGDEIIVLPGDDSLAQRLRDRYALPITTLD